MAPVQAHLKERGEIAIRSDVIAKTHRLNDRQAAAIRHVLESATLDIRTLEALLPRVSRRTLQRDLAALEAKGLLRHEGETNNLLYRLNASVRRDS